jgi:histidyl-tRNA synthetase
MKYANDRGVRFVALVGENEMTEGVIQLKDMESGAQQKLTVSGLIERLK